MNGKAAGGLRISAGGQGISWSWWNWDVNESGGAIPDFGVLTAWKGGALRPAQARILNQLFFRRGTPSHE
jgi:hypothetical protein